MIDGNLRCPRLPMSARPEADIQSGHRKNRLEPSLGAKAERSRRSPLGFQSPLRCGLGCKSGTYEGQQVSIYRVCLGGRAAVREALVGL
jgi:hypothetical protein